MLRLLYAMLIGAAAASCYGCVGEWREGMPPVTYHGRVTNAATGEPVSGICVKADRGRWRWAIFDANRDVIGHAHTDAAGRYTMTTVEGYTNWPIVAQTLDWRWRGAGGGGSSAREVDIAVRPDHLFVSESGIDSDAPVVRRAAGAMKKILWHHAANLDEPFFSLARYAEQGVISERELRVFAENPNLFLGDDRQVKFVWGNDSYFLIPGIAEPMTIPPARSLEDKDAEWVESRKSAKDAAK